MEIFNSLPAKFHAFLLSLGLFVHFLASIVTGTVYVQQPLPVSSTPASITAVPAMPAATSSPRTKVLARAHTTVPIQKQTAVKVVPPATTAATPPTTLDLASTPASAPTVEQLNASARASLVNILCTTAAGGSFNPISGSGVFIDSRGIILTNAHVAQYFLLKDYPFANNIQCIVRAGSPAQPLYTAEVLYLPPEWVAANASQLTSQRAQGTGENDYAFLHITGTVSPSVSLPSSFPSIPMTAAAPEVGAPALLVAYPAGLLSGETIQMHLYSSSAVSTVQTLYSFNGTQYVDLIALGGTVVSQTGSSGGALVGLGSKKLLGIIVTETAGTTTADRQLNAVTIGYIDRVLAKSGKGGLVALLSGDLAQLAADFKANIAPQEIGQLTAVLKKASN